MVGRVDLRVLGSERTRRKDFVPELSDGRSLAFPALGAVPFMKRPFRESPEASKELPVGLFSVGCPVKLPEEVKDDAEKQSFREPGGFPEVTVRPRRGFCAAPLRSRLVRKGGSGSLMLSDVFPAG